MTGPMTGIARIAAAREEQQSKWGHTPEADLRLPLGHLPRLAGEKVRFASDDLHFHKPNWREQAVKHLAQAGALIAAAIDRIEAEDQPGAPL